MGVYRFEWYSRPYLNEEDAQTRANEIVERHNKGESFSSIGKSMGITKQRVHQIYKYAAHTVIESEGE